MSAHSRVFPWRVGLRLWRKAFRLGGSEHVVGVDNPLRLHQRLLPRPNESYTARSLCSTEESIAMPCSLRLPPPAHGRISGFRERTRLDLESDRFRGRSVDMAEHRHASAGGISRSPAPLTQTDCVNLKVSGYNYDCHTQSAAGKGSCLQGPGAGPRLES